jgi:hypothetical protein
MKPIRSGMLRFNGLSPPFGLWASQQPEFIPQIDERQAEVR